MPKAKSKHPRGKKHDLRGATLARLADDCEAMGTDLKIQFPFADQQAAVLRHMATIFRNAAKRERKLGSDPKEFERVMRAANHPWVKDWDRENESRGNFDTADEASDIASLDPTRPKPANYGVCKCGVLHVVLNKTPKSLFGEDDFVFIDKKFDPYFVHRLHTARQCDAEVWWLFYWHSHAREWVTLRKITESERETFRLRSIARDHAELYFSP